MSSLEKVMSIWAATNTSTGHGNCYARAKDRNDIEIKCVVIISFIVFHFES